MCCAIYPVLFIKCHFFAKVGGIHVIKSGADFKQFRIVKLELVRNSASGNSSSSSRSIISKPPSAASQSQLGASAIDSTTTSKNDGTGTSSSNKIPPPKIGIEDLFGGIAYSTHTTARSSLPYRIVRFDRAEFVLSSGVTAVPGKLPPKAVPTHEHCCESAKEESEDELVSRFVIHHETEQEAYHCYNRPHSERSGVKAKQSEPQLPPLFEVVDREAIADRDAAYHLVEVKSDEFNVFSTLSEDPEMKKIVDEYYGMLIINFHYCTTVYSYYSPKRIVLIKYTNREALSAIV